MNQVVKAHLALLGANFIYGLTYSLAKDVMPGYLQPSGFVLIRIIGAVSLFWISSLLFTSEKIEKSDWPRFILCGFFGVALNQVLFFEGLSRTSPINAGIIMVTTPILVLLISSLLIREKITMLKTSGIFIGIVGALGLIVFNDHPIAGIEAQSGDMMVFFNAASYAVYLSIVKKLMHKYQTVTVLKWVFLSGLIFVAPIGYNQAISIEWGQLPLIIWYEIAFIVVGTTFLAYFLNNFALKTLNPTVVSIYIYLQPVLAAFIAIFLGKDEPTVTKVISAILIFIGVYFVSRPNKLESQGL
jgi:drug/metabolite transporter (DMT)-like permease